VYARVAMLKFYFGAPYSSEKACSEE